MRRCSVFLSVLSAILAPIAPAGATQIYWSTGFGQTIERANLDGTGREVVVRTANLPREVAIDSVHGQIYWTGVQGAGLWRVGAAGSGAQKLVSPVGNPYGVALDVTREKMYWAEAGIGSNRIMRANLDGTESQSLITTSTGYPCGLTLDLVNDRMYWLSIQTGTMYRSNLDGTGTVQVLKTGVSPIDLALDIAGGKVYWTENGASYPAYDVVKRANLDGTGIQTLVTGLDNPLGIALDLSAGKMYWADHNTRKIQRANLDGSSIEDVLTGINAEFIALHVPEPGSLALLVLGAVAFMQRRGRPRR